MNFFAACTSDRVINPPIVPFNKQALPGLPCSVSFGLVTLNFQAEAWQAFSSQKGLQLNPCCLTGVSTSCNTSTPLDNSSDWTEKSCTITQVICKMRRHCLGLLMTLKILLHHEHLTCKPDPHIDSVFKSPKSISSSAHAHIKTDWVTPWIYPMCQ